MTVRLANWLALCGFVVLALVLTFPISVDPATAVRDLGDPLLNSWILDWEVHSLLRGSFSGFWDTNIFFPHLNTLAYSELLVPQMLFAAPILALSGSPVLAHNLVLLASFVATAMGAYLLALHLTRSAQAAFLAGLVFAFCPFMFSQLSHLQVSFAVGIPLSFLYLHRFLDDGRSRHALLFGLFYVLQVLGNAYYGVYLTGFAGLYGVGAVVRRGRYRQRRFWLQIGLVAILVFAILAPFYSHYFELKDELGIGRGLLYTAKPYAYLATPPFNRLYGRITAPFQEHEAFLFPGLVASALAVSAVASRFRRRPGGEPTVADGRHHVLGSIFRLVEILIMAVAGALLVLAMGGEFDGRVWSLPFRVTTARNPALLLVLLVIVRHAMLRRWPAALRSVFVFPRLSRPLYPGVLLAGFILSLGTAPFQLLQRYLPGFDSLRVSGRFHIMFMLALAVLAAEGMVLLLARWQGRRRRLLAAGLMALILLEYWSVPVPVIAAPTREEIPSVYQWLTALPTDPVLAILPFRIKIEHPRVYYSTFHRRRMVNGVSGYAPPVYWELADRMRHFPSASTIADLRALKVDLVVVEIDAYRPAARRRLLRRLERPRGLRQVGEFGNTRVYRFASKARVSPPEAAGSPGAVSGTALRRSSWRVRASLNTQAAERAIDGDRSTAWIAPMRPDVWFEVDLAERRRISGATLEFCSWHRAYPRGYQVAVSEDGADWTVLSDVADYRQPIEDFLPPRDVRLRISLPAITARWLRVTQTGRSEKTSWAICELNILTPHAEDL